MIKLPFKVIIAGTREFNNYQVLNLYCEYILQNQSQVIILTGKARGADSLGELYAK